MSAGMPAIAPTIVAVMRIDTIQASGRPGRSRRRSMIAAGAAKTAAVKEATAHITSTAFERPTAEGSFMNWDRKAAHATAMAPPISSAAPTHRWVGLPPVARGSRSGATCTQGV